VGGRSATGLGVDEEEMGTLLVGWVFKPSVTSRWVSVPESRTGHFACHCDWFPNHRVCTSGWEGGFILELRVSSVKVNGVSILSHSRSISVWIFSSIIVMLGLCVGWFCGVSLPTGAAVECREELLSGPPASHPPAVGDSALRCILDLGVFRACRGLRPWL